MKNLQLIGFTSHASAAVVAGTGISFFSKDNYWKIVFRLNIREINIDETLHPDRPSTNGKSENLPFS